MAAPKFPLTMGDGAKVRTMEELREHTDLYTLETHFSDGTIMRWLKNHNYEEFVEKIEGLQKTTDSFHEELCYALGIHITEEMKEKYIAQIVSLSNEEPKNSDTVDTIKEKPTDTTPEFIEKSAFTMEYDVLSEGTADMFASKLNYEDDGFVFYKTDNYFLYASEYNLPDGAYNLWGGFLGLGKCALRCPWHRTDLHGKEDVIFPIQEETEERMLYAPNILGLIIKEEHVVWKDCLIYRREGQ